MIKAIFFAAFDVNEGPKVHHQVPPDSVHPSASSASIPLFAFPPLAQSIIPAPPLSNRPLQLLTLERPHYRILSHPITISGEQYPRNAFTFNFSLVLSSETGFHSYLPIVKKLATLFHTLETQETFLTTELSLNPTPNTGRIHAICEILLEDLNNYSECMIPITGTNTTLNLKLFPIYPPPPPLHAYQVPLLIVSLDPLLSDPTWDLTLQRTLPFINGVNSVQRIAWLADADLRLVRKAIRHLLYYGCVTLLDIFSFSAIYASTPSIASFVEDGVMQEECLRYIALPSLGTIASTSTSKVDTEPSLSKTRLVELYLSLHQGQSVKAWCIEHPSVTKLLDIRRFITFGVIKGFLYRVHWYAIASAFSTTTSSTVMKGGKGATQRGHRDGNAKMKGSDEETLGRYLDGTHCFDEICTEMRISERELLGKLKRWGDVQIICR
ncbi:MAG: hypothetical protein Q9164_005805 [Protoblastenia rupestris]